MPEEKHVLLVGETDAGKTTSFIEWLSNSREFDSRTIVVHECPEIQLFPDKLRA